MQYYGHSSQSINKGSLSWWLTATHNYTELYLSIYITPSLSTKPPSGDNYMYTELYLNGQAHNLKKLNWIAQLPS